VETVGALEDRYGDRHLAVRHHWQPKKHTQGDDGSLKKLAAAHRWMTRRIVPARHKGHGRQGTGRDSVARGTPKRETFRKIHQA
jgi:hypothetical protein